MGAPAATASSWCDVSFRVMGTRGRVLVLGGPPGLAADARARLADLEARWSRFLPTSELSRLNATPGRPVRVSEDTFAVVRFALAAHAATGGRFDPTVHDAMVRIGYDRDFGMVPTAPDGPLGPPRPTPGGGGIELDELVRTVTVPAGTRLDLGGVGKGVAVDLVLEELVGAGAAGACVDLGGDLRVAGTPTEADGWPVVVDPALGTGVRLRLGAGAVATSTSLRRRWTRAGEPVHHLVDPATGAPARSGLAAVTVVAATTAWAEVLAKAAFVAGPAEGAARLRDAGVTGLLVHDDGRTEQLAGLRELVA